VITATWIKNQQEETPSQREKKKDVASTALRRKRNGDIPLGYLGQRALRREQCDEMPESGIERHFLGKGHKCFHCND
jgi:hypothetical protein